MPENRRAAGLPLGGRQELLDHIANAGHPGPGQTIAARLLEEAALLMQADLVYATRYLADGMVDVTDIFATGQIPSTMRYDPAGLPCETVLSGTPVFIGQDLQLQVLSGHPASHHAGFQAYCAVPLYDADNDICGHLVALSVAPLAEGQLRLPLMRITADRLMAERARDLAAGNVEDALEEIRHLKARLANTTQKDMLIGCPNRHQLVDQGEREVARANRYGTGLGMVMLDVDHFRAANERWGQEAGNQMLIDIAQLCMARCRTKMDFFARLSGDEFAILMPNTDEAGVTIFAERLLMDISRLVMEWQGKRMAVTASLGAAILHPADADFDAFYARTDAALQGAKSAGRNCLCFSRIDETEAL